MGAETKSCGQHCPTGDQSQKTWWPHRRRPQAALRSHEEALGGEETEGFLVCLTNTLPQYRRRRPSVGRAEPNVHMLNHRRSLSIKSASMDIASVLGELDANIVSAELMVNPAENPATCGPVKAKQR